MTELTIRQPGMSPVKADLPNGAYLIGAGRNCHIRLEHPDISGRHAQLVVSDNEINIMDLGSSNGTFIGGSDDPLFSNRMVRVSPKKSETLYCGILHLLKQHWTIRSIFLWMVLQIH